MSKPTDTEPADVREVLRWADRQITDLCATVNALAKFQKVRPEDYAEKVRAALAKMPTDAAPRFTVILDGGLVQDVVSHDPQLIDARYVVIDLDVEGADEDDLDTVKLEDGEEVRAWVSVNPIGKQLIEFDLPQTAPTAEELGLTGLTVNKDAERSREMLLKERRALLNTYGSACFGDGSMAYRVAEIDRELMLSEADIETLNAGGTVG